MRTRFSIPFSLTLLLLMGLIVVPLTGTLFWLGDQATDQLEHSNVHQRMASLTNAVGNFLRDGLRQVVLMGTTLSETAIFQSTTPGSFGPDDEERLRLLRSMVGRHELLAAAFVGYANGEFTYAGRTDSLSAEQRHDYGAPDDARIILRYSQAVDVAQRQETWRFVTADGSLTAVQSRPAHYDPRGRPWYKEALTAGRAILTDPYVFADADVVGISAGIPLPSAAGVFGFDVTLDTLSRLVADYKITPNSIIMVGNGQGDVFVQTSACPPGAANCLPGGGEARLALSALVRRSQGKQRLHDRTGSGDGAYELFIEPMQGMFGTAFIVAAAVPVLELTVDSRALMTKSEIAAGIAILLAVVAALAASMMLSRPLKAIVHKTERIRHLDFSDRAPVDTRIAEVLRLSRSIEHMRSGLEIFGRYVSRGLVEQIMRSPERTGMRGVRREVTVMFTDIEGFSRIAEQLAPEVLTRRLSHYFEVLEPAIAGNRGTVDKYIGDSIMAYWNAPQVDDDHVAHAVRAALQLAAASRALAAKWRRRGRPVFRTRIGVHTGPAVIGNVGTKERINYTMVGPVANQASRLEGLNKAYGTDVLVSGETKAAVADRFVWRLVDRVVAAGTTEPHDIYEPLHEIGHEDVGTRQAPGFPENWERAREHYRAGRFGEALAILKDLARPHGNESPPDGPCEVLIGRCERFLREGPPKGWDGVWRFEIK